MWFSHGSGAVSALEPLERKPFSRLRSEELVLRLCFLGTERMRRGRSPSRSPSRPRRPVWDNPEGGDGENLHDRRSTQRVRGTSPGRAVLTGESSSGTSDWSWCTSPGELEGFSSEDISGAPPTRC